MEVDFDDQELDKLEVDARFSAGYSQPVVKGFRKVMQAIRAAKDERDLYKLRGLHFEKLSGSRQHQHSLRINDQWRLIVEIRENNAEKKIVILEITNHYE